MNRPVTLKHIDGRVVSYPSITAFAKKHRVSKHHVSQIMQSETNLQKHRLFYKGWYDPEKLATPVILQDDNDKLHVVDNYAEFIVQNELTTGMFFKLLEDKISWHKGFRKPNTPKPVWKRKHPLFEYTLKSPKGKIITVTSLGKVAKISHLNRRCFYKLGTNWTQYKGWRLVKVKELFNYWNEKNIITTK